MIWFISILLSVFCIFMTYYMAYKKKEEPNVVIGLAVFVSFGAGFVWGLAISMQNLGNVNLNASADSELMAAFAPYITSAIIHFAILFPAYLVAKNDDTENKNDNNATISPHPAVQYDKDEDNTFYVNGEKLISPSQLVSYKKFDASKSFAENVRALRDTEEELKNLKKDIDLFPNSVCVFMATRTFYKSNILRYILRIKTKATYDITDIDEFWDAKMAVAFAVDAYKCLAKCADTLSDRCIVVIMNECAKQRVRFRDGFMNAIRELIGDCGEDRETLINTIADYCRKLIMKNGEV